MLSHPHGSTGLGHYLQGIQHFGITVDNLEKSIEFYTEVLGGKVAISGDSFSGDVLHNTLFQKEEIEALNQGISPRRLGVPNLKTGDQDVLDVRLSRIIFRVSNNSETTASNGKGQERTTSTAQSMWGHV